MNTCQKTTSTKRKDQPQVATESKSLDGVKDCGGMDASNQHFSCYLISSLISNIDDGHS